MNTNIACRFLFLILVLQLYGSCKQNIVDGKDPIALSESFQPWNQTAQPEGSVLHLSLGVYAKVLCSACFVSGRNPAEAFRNSGKLLLDSQYYTHVSYSVDSLERSAMVSIGDSVHRKAIYFGDQGCILEGREKIQFEPVTVSSALPEASSMDWPMGDASKDSDATYDQNLLDSVLSHAFAPGALTAAFIAVHQGDIVLEQYGPDVHRDMQLESWSMGKSLTGILIGRLIHQGFLELDADAPIAEWSAPGDPRGEITIRDLMQMSSGLRFPAHQDPDLDEHVARLAHMYIYTEAIDVFDFAVNRPLEYVPGTTGRYRNCDPLALGYILRNIVESNERNYWTWPQEELFDKIGIRRQVLETDPFGNFIMTGYDYGTARNWARLGLLYLNDGIWMGDRLLPEGFVDFVSNPAPGWEEPVYGGLVWLNRTGQLNLPEDAYCMAGAGGQYTMIVPSLDLVVVRMGHSEGSATGFDAMNEALGVLVRAIKQSE